MYISIIFCLYICLIINVLSECKYIRRDGKAYELDSCSYSSTFSEISWGFYCIEGDDNDNYTAVYKQWNSEIDCGESKNKEADIILFDIDCNGIEDDCDCYGDQDIDQCLKATFTISDCSNSNELYQNTTYITNLCQQTGDESSQQIVCHNGDTLQTMQYENTICSGYGFGINDGQFDLVDNDITSINDMDDDDDDDNTKTTTSTSEICAKFVCQSQGFKISLSLSVYGIITIMTIIAYNLI